MPGRCIQGVVSVLWQPSHTPEPLPGPGHCARSLPSARNHCWHQWLVPHPGCWSWRLPSLTSPGKATAGGLRLSIRAAWEKQHKCTTKYQPAAPADALKVIRVLLCSPKLDPQEFIWQCQYCRLRSTTSSFMGTLIWVSVPVTFSISNYFTRSCRSAPFWSQSATLSYHSNL